MSKRFVFDHDLHIHSYLSSCSRDPEQTPERILQYAKDNGLSTICLTNHYWDSSVEGAHPWYVPQNFDNLAKALPLPQADGIRFLFGCETDMRKDMTIGIPHERYGDFDFIIVPTTHLQFSDFTIASEDYASVDKKARLWVDRLDALLAMDLPFYKVGIAHLVTRHTAELDPEGYIALMKALSDGEMRRLFTKVAELGAGIELNSFDLRFSDEEADTVLRPFMVAKECGCRFYLGSDSHHPAALLQAPAIFERAIDLLDLRESDKFVLQ